MTTAEGARPGDLGSLLAVDEPAAFELVAPAAPSRFMLLCDHASRRIPRALGSLGLAEADLERHIAWDLGAAGLSRLLAARLDAWLILQNYSRLVIDCNRQLERADSMAKQSEDTHVPGNLEVTPANAAARAREIFHPYHGKIRAELDERAARKRPPVLLFVHSFTPVYRGVSRPWHAGVLYHRDTRLALPLLEALRREPGLTIGENEPYAVSAVSDYGIIEHAERRELLHVELEVRQDLLATPAGQAEWAERLARLLLSCTPSDAGT